MKTTKMFVSLVNYISTHVLLVSYLAFVVSTVTTVADISCRNLFNKPILGVTEFNECLMPLIVYMALAATQKHRGHIRVTLLLTRLKLRYREAFDLLTYVLGFIFICSIAILTGRDALNAFHSREAVMVGMNLFPIWWSKLLIPIGLGAFSLQYLSDIVVLVTHWWGWEWEETMIASVESDAV